ncbi:MAG: c-type cytochrome [Hyphomicrobiaceae bacterium]
MRRFVLLCLSLMACAVATTSETLAQTIKPEPKFIADAKRGEQLFKQCQACHTTKHGPTTKVGPSLAGVIKRRAGQLHHFDYSNAMKRAGKRGLVWTPKKLDAYLKAPTDYMPDNKMAFLGVKSASQRRDLIAYLEVISAPPLPVRKPQQ